MKNTLNLIWQFKWLALITLLIEWLILLPVYFLMNKFGNGGLAINLEVTPIGSSEFIATFISAMFNQGALLNSFLAFLVLLPILFLTKLALSAGTMASMQQQKLHLSSWFGHSGRYFLASFGLFLRWLIIPVVLCAIFIALFKVAGVESKKPLLAIIAFIWLLCFSWFYLALNTTVQGEKHALKKGRKLLISHFGQVIINIIIFAVVAAVIQYVSWLVFKNNGEASTGLIMAIVCALLLAIATRTLVLFWQASYVTVWQKSQ